MQDKFYYISVLNVVSALAVVFLHANGIFWAHPKGDTWITANIIESLFIFAVPVFYMISGSTLVEYSSRYTTRTFFKKRFHKTVVPFLFWSFVAMLYCYYLNKPGIVWTPDGVIRGFLTNKFMGIYWFFMPLFAIYLSMPVLTNIQNKVRVFSYMAIYVLVSISIISFVKPFGFDYFPGALVTPISGGLLLFPLIGYVLHKIEIPKRWRIILYLVGLSCMICHCVFTIVLTPENGSICRYFKGSQLIPNVLYAASVFVFFKYNSDCLFKINPIRQFIDFVKPATLGVYLIHIYFHYAAKDSGIDISSIVYRSYGAIVIFVTCVIVVRIIQLTRIGRIIFP